MSEKIVTRSADISPKEAREGLAQLYPKGRIASFEVKTDKEGNDFYEAKVIVSADNPFAGGPPEADGPPSDDGGDDGAEDAPPVDEEDSEEKSDKPKDEKKDGVEKEIASLTKIVKEIAKAVGVDTSAMDDDKEGPPSPEDGAPDGADVPPPPPVADDAPLPPPAKPHGAPGGGGLGMPFSKVDKFAGDQHVAALRQTVAGRRAFSMAYEDGHLPSLEVANLFREMFPDFKLDKFAQRDALVDGKQQKVYVAGMVRV